MNAPLNWAYCLFPLKDAGEETLCLEGIVHLANNLIERAAQTEDRACLGPVIHWAHQLKSQQGPDGAWPTTVNARTGDAMGDERTRAPALLLERLGEILCSTEFEDAVSLARTAEPSGPEGRNP